MLLTRNGKEISRAWKVLPIVACMSHKRWKADDLQKQTMARLITEVVRVHRIIRITWVAQTLTATMKNHNLQISVSISHL
jgi:hypothetical protein